jgi:Uma2 family endonuclease
MISVAEPARKVVWTYQDLELMAPDGRRHEVLDGEWIVTPAPTTTHQTISKALCLELVQQVERSGDGIVFYAPVDVIFSNTRVAEPDLLVVRSARRNIISERGIEGAPDLVIEIVSPSSERADREIKRKLYAEERVAEYWLVEPRTHRVLVLRLADSAYEVAGEYGPGETATSVAFAFSIDVDRVFA